MMIHDFDMARFLIGEEVTELMATGNCLVDPEIGKCGDVDTAVVLLKFKNGALGTIDNSRRAVYGYDQRVEVFGSKGCAAAGNKIPTEVTLHNAESTMKR
jgi:myo-inositol 2-dehydrogenase/D-chiro-inositol 1-dehydrogenase